MAAAVVVLDISRRMEMAISSYIYKHDAVVFVGGATRAQLLCRRFSLCVSVVRVACAHTAHANFVASPMNSRSYYHYHYYC